MTHLERTWTTCTGTEESTSKEPRKFPDLKQNFSKWKISCFGTPFYLQSRVVVNLQSPKVTRTWNVSLNKINRSLWLIVCIAVSYPCRLHGSKCNRFCLAVLIPIDVKIQMRPFKFGSICPLQNSSGLLTSFLLLRRIFKQWCQSWRVLGCTSRFRQGICVKCETKFGSYC